MASAFNLTAQINLQGPGNLKPIVSKIKKELGSIKTKLNLEVKPGIAKNIGQITRSLNNLSKAAISANSNIANLNTSLSSLASSFNNASSTTSAAVNSLNTTAKAAKNNTKAINQSRTAIEEFGKQSGLAIKRFAAFSSVTTVVYGFLNALDSAFKEFIVFNQEIVRLSQVTNKSITDLKGLSSEITRLSTSLGVSSSDILKVSTTLAQAGFSAEETKIALEALAKSALAPSFENIADTTEGAIAAMRQFGLQAKDLDGALGSINAVAAAFAVEAGDIITAIQRTGGVFAASSKGVSEGTDALNEFIAVFTSIRATTRESAETIATGLRTIFTRIQRSSTIQLLKDYGVELRDLEGKFVGPYEAVRRLSQGLNRLDPRSEAFASISEELGGFRQIGKVIPLIQQFALSEQALNVAMKGSGSLAKDAIDAQQSLAIQFNKTRERFLALIRDIGDTGTFKAFVTTTLTLANALISLGGALKPILPLLLTFTAIKIGSGLRQYASGFAGAFGGGGGAGGMGGAPTGGGGGGGTGGGGSAAAKATSLTSNTTALTTLNQSVLALNQNIVNTNSLLLNRPARGFATGGLVPGVGNSDSVSARLTPGEFVIRKKAVEAIGAGNLQKMNKYQWGGKVAKLEKLYPSIGSAFGYDDVLNDQINDTSSFVEVKPEQLSKENINKWKRSKNKSWKKFEDLLERSFGVGKSAGGSGSKWSLLDFPYTRSEAKFMPKGSTYNDPDTIKGNNEATIAAKNYLFEQSTFKNKGNKPNLKVEELEKIQSLSPATVYWGDPKKFNSAGLYNLGGKIQKFVGGGQALGARPTIKELDETELAQLSTSQLIKYAKDLAYDIFTTGGAGMAVGSEFIEVPKEKIIPELESSLVSYMGKRGFWREKVAPFGKAMQQKTIQSGKLGREDALKSQVAKYADEVAARSQEWTSIRSGSSIDSYLMSALQDPILSDYKSSKEGRPLAKTFHATRLRKAVNEALDSFDDFDYSGANIDKLVSGMAAKRFAVGGNISGEDTVPALLTPGEFVINKKAAQKIGYGKLNKLNHADKIQGFNKGGAVGVQRFAAGGQAMSLDRAAVVAAITSVLLPEVQKLGASFVKLEGQASNFGAALGGAIQQASSMALSSSLALGAVGANNKVRGIGVGVGTTLGAVSGGLTEFTGKALEKILVKNTEAIGKFSKDLEDFKNAPTEELRLEATKRLEESFTNMDNRVRSTTDAINSLESARLAGEKLDSFNSSVLTIITSMVALRAATFRLTSLMSRMGTSAFAARFGQGAAVAGTIGRIAPQIAIGLTVISAAIELFSFFNTSLKTSAEQLNKVSEALEETAKNSRAFSLNNERYSESILASFDQQMQNFKTQGVSQQNARGALGNFNLGNEFNLLFRTQLESVLSRYGIGVRPEQSLQEVRASTSNKKGFDAAVVETQKILTADLFRRAKRSEGITDEETITKLFNALGGEGSAAVQKVAQEYAGAIIEAKLSTDSLAIANNKLKTSMVSLNNVLDLVEANFKKVLTQTTNSFNDLDRQINIINSQPAFFGGEIARRDVATFENLKAASPQEITSALSRSRSLLNVGNDPTQIKLFNQFEAQTKAVSILEKELPLALENISNTNVDPDQIGTIIRDTLGPSLKAALGDENKDTVNKLLSEISSGIINARENKESVTSVAELGTKSKTLSEIIDKQGKSLDIFKSSLETVAKSADLVSEQHKKLYEEEQAFRDVLVQRKQTELSRDIELKRSLRQPVSLDTLNSAFYGEIEAFTADLAKRSGLDRNIGVPAGGTSDVDTLIRALEASRAEQLRIQREAVGPEATFKNIGERDETLRRELTVSTSLIKALKALSDQSVAVKNTFEEIAKQKDLLKSQRQVLLESITGGGDPSKILQLQDAVKSLELLNTSGGKVNNAQLIKIKESLPLLEQMMPEKIGPIFDNFFNKYLVSVGQTGGPQVKEATDSILASWERAIQEPLNKFVKIVSSEGAAQQVFDDATIKTLQIRTQGISSVFDQMWTSLQSSFPGIIKFFDATSKRDLGLEASKTSPIVDNLMISAARERVRGLGPQYETKLGPDSIPYMSTTRGALTPEQVQQFNSRLKTNTTTMSDFLQVLSDVDKTIQSNIDTQKNWWFPTINAMNGLAKRAQFLNDIVGGISAFGVGVVSMRKQEQRRLQENIRIQEENATRQRQGAPQISVPGFPLEPFKPLPLDTSSFDTTVDKMVAAFNGENNNINQLATAVTSLGTVANSLKTAIEELRRTIPDGKVAVNIDQKSSVTVDIPEGVDIRSSSMRLDNRDAETLASTIGDSLGKSIGSFFTFSGQG